MSTQRVATAEFVGHLWQVFDIDRRKSRLVVFSFDLVLIDGKQRFQTGNLVTMQAPVEAGAGDVRIDECAYDGEQIIERQ